jgi:hypothetical protein
MKRYYYAIIERSYDFCVLETGCGTHEQAWDKANKLNKKYPDIIADYDVLIFETEIERLEFIRESTKA